MGQLLAFLDAHAGAVQAMTSIAIVGLTVWLILATLRYVRVANESLKLSREQFGDATRVEVFLKLRSVPQTSTASEAFIDLANLYEGGIWWEKYSATVTAREKNTVGETVERAVQKVIPAYGVEGVPCVEAFYQSYLTTGLPHEKPFVSVKIEATYRARGKWHTAHYEVREIILLGKFVSP